MALSELLQIAIRGALPPEEHPFRKYGFESDSEQGTGEENDNTAEQVVSELRPVTW